MLLLLAFLGTCDSHCGSVCFGSVDCMTTNINNPVCCPAAQGTKASTALNIYVPIAGIFKANVLSAVALLALAPWIG